MSPKPVLGGRKARDGSEVRRPACPPHHPAGCGLRLGGGDARLAGLPVQDRPHCRLGSGRGFDPHVALMASGPPQIDCRPDEGTRAWAAHWPFEAPFVAGGVRTTNRRLG